MLTYTFYRYQPLPRGPERNALFESFLIHSRLLLDFFCTQHGYATDSKAVHYVQGWTCPRPMWLKTHKTRCDKLIAHVPYDRVDIGANARAWKNLPEVHEFLCSQWQAFLAALDPERKVWFTNPKWL